MVRVRVGVRVMVKFGIYSTPFRSNDPSDNTPVTGQQCQSTEGKISHSMDLLTPSSPGGLPALSLTTKGSWLPWERVAMPLISPLMPVPQTVSKH